MANYQNTPGKSWIMTFGILKIIFGLFSVVVMLTSPSLPSFKLFGIILYGAEIVVGILGNCFAGVQSKAKSLTLLILGGIQLFLYLLSGVKASNLFLILAIIFTIGFLFGAGRNFFASRE